MNKKFIVYAFFNWVIFCTIFVFTNPILDSRGFSVIDVGIAFFISGVSVSIFQPAIAHRFSNNKKILINMLIILMILVSLQMVVTGKVFYIIYILSMICMSLTEPFFYSLIMDLIHIGKDINLAVARGFGSLSFAITSVGLGYFSIYYGYSLLPIFNIVCISIMLLVLLSIKENIVSNREKNEVSTPILKKYPEFKWYLLGVIALMIPHIAVANFLLNIMQEVGKGSEYMGLGLAMAASFEIVVGIFYTRLKNKFGNENLLLFAAIFFTIKISVAIIGLIMNSAEIIIFSQFLQIFAFAVYLPSGIHHVNNVMEKEDNSKGMAYVGSAGAIAGVVSSLLTSKLIETKGVLFMVIVMTFVSLIGSLIICINLRKTEK